MQDRKDNTTPFERRKNERGAALVMVLMLSSLLLVGVIALLLEASMNTANVTDATSEEQAYYAAESGIQSVVNVLRANTCPSPLFPSSPNCNPNTIDPLATTDEANKISYFKAIKFATSNAAGDPSTVARLSRWLPYTDPTDPESTILLGGAGSRFRYKVTVENPDNLSNTLSYNTSANINSSGSPVYNTPPDVNGNSLTFEYVPPLGTQVVDVSTGDGPAPLGSWRITGNGPTFDTVGAIMPARVRFMISVNITQPYNTTKLIRGYLEKGLVGLVRPGNIGTVRIFYDSKNFITLGSQITISDDYSGTIIQEEPPAIPTGEGGTYRAGFQTTPIPPPAVNVYGETLIGSRMTAPEPIRLIVRSTGYGPFGSTKTLESIIQKNYFNGLGAPSPLTLIGPPCTPVGSCTPVPNPSNAAPNFVFQPGSSTGTKYDGKDILLKAFLPPIGMTNDTNVTQAMSRLTQPPPNKFNGAVFGTPSNVADELPFWLQNPRNLETTLRQLRATADASNTLYEVGEPRPAYGGGRYGDFINASGLTFIEGDLEFAQEGGGILVVTGTLTFRGGFQFNGLVIVTGPGGIQRTGGGSGSLQGNMIVAPYDNWSKTTCMSDVTVTNKLNCFYAPRYDISGGGSSDITYNSNNVKNGLGALTNFVKGVAEK